MTPGVFFHPVTAATTAGVALWLSRASFDVAGTTDAPVRVAMLPSAAELVGLVVLMLLVAAGIALVARNGKSMDAGFWDGARDPLLPLLGLAVLVLPYLPLVPDWVLALRLLAGPMRLIIWIVVIGQVLWLLSPRIGSSNAALLFAFAAVFLSAPFIMNVRATPAILAALLTTIGNVPSVNWSAAPAGALGSLFDQEYGIFVYAPVLLLAVAGLAGMARERPRIAVPLAAAILLLLLLPGTVDPWWSKSMLPGRHQLFLLPLLVPPIAWLYARLPEDSFQRAGAQLLLLTSLAVTVILVTFGDQVPARQEGDGISALFYWMSPAWQLWSEMPTYVADTSLRATGRVLIWLTAFGVTAFSLSRREAPSGAVASLAVTLTATALFFAVISTTAGLMSNVNKRFDVESRVMLPLLETFDPVARPIAVRYDMFSLTTPDRLPPLFTLSAVRGSRTAPQPVRVALNARFRLPAGEYLLDLEGAESAAGTPNGAVALQMGREGRPFQSWPLALPPRGHVQERFLVPLDSEFIGFRAARQVERDIVRLRVRPVQIVEARRRFPAATVLSAAAFAPADVFFHDSNAYAEPEGFWIRGRATARMTLRKREDSDARLVLAVHSGARPNAVEISTPGWSQRLDLVPGVTQRVVVPAKEGESFLPLVLTASDGFVPSEVETSRDRRLLGAWIAFIPDDISRTSAGP